MVLLAWQNLKNCQPERASFLFKASLILENNL